VEVEMELYNIVNTEIKDLHFIYSLFDEAISYQKRKQYPVWAGYDKEVLKREIETQHQYKIVINNTIACIFSICYSDGIIWREREKGDSLYLHRIAVNPFYKGQKQFGRILNWCVGYAIKRKLQNIRMDTWAENPNLVEYYKSFGFGIVGKLTTPDSEELPIPQRNNKVVLLEFKLEIIT
jgi:ribosomal protein S18 acetylase RimI-like enzyme